MATDDSADGTVRNGAAGGGGSRWPRRLGITAMVAGVLGALFVVAVFVLPNSLAHYLVDRELEPMGLRPVGFQTLDIDLWNSEVTLGPVRLDRDGAEPLRLEKFILAYDLSALFSKRVFVQKVIITGVDIAITRAADGAFAINGTPLAAFLPAPGPEPAAPAVPLAWQAGLDSLELRDSRLLYADAQGRTGAVELASLSLAGFRTWEPDSPGSFDLRGRFNGIALALRGTARPFADRIVVDVEEQVAELELAKVEKLTGPLGLARGAGVVEARMTRHLEVFPDGAVDMGTRGEVSLTGLDLAADGLGTVTLGDGKVTVDVVTHLSPDDRVKATGDVTLEGTGAGLDQGPDLAASVTRLRVALAGLAAEGALGGDLTATAQPTVAMQGLTLTGPAAATLGGLEIPLGSTRVTLKGGALDLATGGAVVLRDLAVSEPVEATVESGEAPLDSLAVAVDGDTVKVSGRVGLKLSGVAAKTPVDARLAALDLPLEQVALVLAGGRLDAQAKGKATLRGAAVTLPDGTAGLESGEAGFQATAAGPGWTLAGDLAARGLRASSGALGGAEVAVDDLSLAGLKAADSLDVDLARVALGGVAAKVADGKAARLDLKALEVTGVQVRGGADLTVAQVLLRALDAAVSRALLDQAGGAEEKPAPAGERPRVKVGRLALADGAKVVVRDESVTPAFSATVDLTTLEVKDLDTTDPAQRTTLAVAGTVNEFTKLKVDGWVAAFGDKPSFDLAGGIQALELFPVSPYAAQAVGMNLESGRLSADGTGKAESGKLDAKVNLDVLGLKFSPLSPEDQKRLSASVGMPVETVVGLLEDSEGRIKFSVPVKGDLENPDFDLSQVIGKAVGGAIAAAATGAFKLLFPPAALVSLVSAAGNGKVAFKPVSFDPGSAELGPSGATFADNLAHLMEERPKLGVQMCGRATAGDINVKMDALLAAKKVELQKAIDAQQAKAAKDGKKPEQPAPVAEVDAATRAALEKEATVAMEALAVARTRAVKRYLVEEHKVPAERVSECRALFDAKDTGLPRVDVSL
ncbi:MAG: DUF748 domain-containing protein [Hyphomicrobiales bacterium]|nr:DUF748 domain-containing protein [Hyphomicrobiales bacterium]